MSQSDSECRRSQLAQMRDRHADLRDEAAYVWGEYRAGLLLHDQAFSLLMGITREMHVLTSEARTHSRALDMRRLHRAGMGGPHSNSPRALSMLRKSVNTYEDRTEI